MSKVLVKLKPGHPHGVRKARLADDSVIDVTNTGVVIEEKQISQEMLDCQGYLYSQQVTAKSEGGDAEAKRLAAEEADRVKAEKAAAKAAAAAQKKAAAKVKAAAAKKKTTGKKK